LPFSYRAADAELAVRPVRDLDAAVADDAAQVAFVVRLGEDAQQRAVASHFQHQPAGSLGGQPLQHRRSGQAAPERGGRHRPEIETVPNLRHDLGDVGHRPAESAVAGHPQLERPLGAVVHFAHCALQILVDKGSCRGGPAWPPCSKRAPT
jgi:hypothetical protein